MPASLSFAGEQLGIGIGSRVWLKVPQSFRIDLLCPKCDRETTFIPLVDEWPSEKSADKKADSRSFKDDANWRFRLERPIFLAFSCSRCIRQLALFALEFEVRGPGAVLRKVGHSPGLPTRVSPRIAKAMGADVGLFRKGLASEFHGFGIGAFAYFRQVAENIVEGLLKRLRVEATASSDAELLGAIDGLNPKAPASEKIGIVKDHLPASLRPDGMNPLGAIHKALSQGIHAGTDEECLAEATGLRVALTFVIQELAERKEKRDAYVAAVRAMGTEKR
jgi:hypothetical protein